MKTKYLIAGALGAMLLAPQAYAFSVIDTIDNTNIAGGDGSTDGVSIAAESFDYAYSSTPGAGLSVTVDLANLTGNTPAGPTAFQSSTGSIIVYLVDNTGGSGPGVAGVPTWTTGTSGVTGLTNDVEVGTISASLIGNSATPVSLYISSSMIAQIEAQTANNEYWLVLSLNNAATGGTSNIDWNYNSGSPNAGTGVTNQEFDFDPAGGEDIGPATGGTYDVSINAPEPASLALIGSAMAGLGLIRRRRRSRTA
jgi:PEP-CTERM motif